jgi:hypothetical protein
MQQVPRGELWPAFDFWQSVAASTSVLRQTYGGPEHELCDLQCYAQLEMWADIA